MPPNSLMTKGLSHRRSQPSNSPLRLRVNSEMLVHQPPTSVVPDVNGGIVFERRENGITEVFHVWEDNTLEYQCFEGTHLVERRSL